MTIIQYFSKLPHDKIEEAFPLLNKECIRCGYEDLSDYLLITHSLDKTYDEVLNAINLRLDAIERSKLNT